MQRVIVYVDGFNFYYGLSSNRYIRLERHEPKFSTYLLPGELVQPTTGYIIRRPDKWV